jgi:hypothetical protein
MSHAVYWAGIPCALDTRAPTRFSHARGLEPARATIAIPRRLFTTLVPAERADPFALADPVSPALLSYLNNETPAPADALAPVPMPFVGDLLIVQDDGDGTRRVTVYQRQMYFAGATVVDADFQDRTSSGSNPLLAIELVGIQDFWDDYGEITEEWNRLRSPAEPRAAADYRGSIDVATQAELDAKRYTAPTSLEGGRLPKPLRWVLQACFNALPGKLQIVRWPAGAPLVEDLRAWGASPKEVIRALCEQHGIYLHVGPELSVRAFLRGEGVIGEANGASGAIGADNDQAHDPETGVGAWSAAVAADRYLRRPTRRPDQVLVVGDRTIMDAAVDYCRPVLYYRETPDPAFGRKPPAAVVLEVRPENLALLASGRAPSEAEATDELSAFLLGLNATDAAGFVAPFPPVGAPPVEVARLTWQRLLLVGNDDERWHEVIPGMPERVRDVLQAQLGWVYQVPPEFRRLLPLADRAAVDHRGERLPIMVEAFGFRAIRSRGKRGPAPARSLEDLEGGLPGAEAAARKELTDELARIRREIEEDHKRIKMLTPPAAEELLVALADHAKKKHPDATVSGFFDTMPRVLLTGLQNYAQQLGGVSPDVTFLLVDALTFGNSLPELSEDASASEVFLRARNAEFRLLASQMRKAGLPVPPQLGDAETAQAQIREIEERIKSAEASCREIVRKIDPRHALQNELAAVETELTRIRAKDGRVSRDLFNKALKLQEEIDKLDEAEAKAIAEEEKEIEIVTHVNLPRRSVPYTVLDAALGIIKIDTPTPPVWLAQTNVADPGETFAYFMPVRVTFGTMNGADADQVSGQTPGPSNPYLSQMAEALAETPELQNLVGVVGHVLPSGIGELSTRFGFTREDMSGNAKVDRARARRVTVKSSPSFRELVDLGGRTNREKLRERARAYAQALLERPADVPDGSLVLRGPRNVLCNGVISAVETRWVGPGGFVTEVSFHVDTEPLPGLEGELEATPYRTTFGIDVEESRDR